MGVYVNPKGQTKEQFLRDNGIAISLKELLKYDADLAETDLLPVCLVDNGPFTAAAVIYNDRELNDFTRPDDFRAKAFFLVEYEKLKAVSDIENYRKLGNEK